MNRMALRALILGAMIAVPGAAQDKAPAKDEGLVRIRELEEKLRKARTIQIVVAGVRTVEIHESGVKIATNILELRSEFQLQSDGKTRVALTHGARGDPAPDRVDAIHDGSALRASYKGIQAPSPRTWTTQEIPSAWRETLLKDLVAARASAVVVPTFSGLGKDRDPDTQFIGVGLRQNVTLEKAAAPVADRVGDRDALAIGYEWKDRTGGRDLLTKGKLWLDAGTGAPLKRNHRWTLDLESRRLEITEEESFESFRLDEPIDAGVFAVPKGK
jgi:hypothetical protein